MKTENHSCIIFFELKNKKFVKNLKIKNKIKHVIKMIEKFNIKSIK